MTTQTIARRRRPRDVHPKRTDGEPVTQKLPEYLEADEVAAIIRAADDPRARLLMLEQWRAGLRVSEALALEVSDLSLGTENPTFRVRAAVFRLALSYGTVSDGRPFRRPQGDGVALGAGRGEACRGAGGDTCR